MAFKPSTHWRKVVSCTVTRTFRCKLQHYLSRARNQWGDSKRNGICRAPPITLVSAEEGGGDGMLELKAGTPSHAQRASCITNAWRHSQSPQHKILATEFLSFALCSTPRRAVPMLKKVSDKTRLTMTHSGSFKMISSVPKR
jgi:hypothetical protein